jgi:hypothetical protein
MSKNYLSAKAGSTPGFYTSLLDFSSNIKVAYFATLGSEAGKIGVLYAFNADEYRHLSNPYAGYGVS